MASAERRLAERHHHGRVRREPLKQLAQHLLDERRVHLDLADLSAIISSPWPTVSMTFSNVACASFAALSPAKVRARESSFSGALGDSRAGFAASIRAPFSPLAGKWKSALVSSPTASANALRRTSPSPMATGSV